VNLSTLLSLKHFPFIDCIYVLQVNEAVDGLIDELHYLQDQVNNIDPIAVIPAEIQDQISNNRVRIFTCLFFIRCTFSYLKLDGCIVWNAHNTVLGEEALLIYRNSVKYNKYSVNIA